MALVKAVTALQARSPVDAQKVAIVRSFFTESRFEKVSAPLQPNNASDARDWLLAILQWITHPIASVEHQTADVLLTHLCRRRSGDVRAMLTVAKVINQLPESLLAQTTATWTGITTVHCLLRALLQHTPTNEFFPYLTAVIAHPMWRSILVPAIPSAVPHINTQRAILRLCAEFPIIEPKPPAAAAVSTIAGAGGAAAVADVALFRSETVVRWLALYPLTAAPAPAVPAAKDATPATAAAAADAKSTTTAATATPPATASSSAAAAVATTTTAPTASGSTLPFARPTAPTPIGRHTPSERADLKLFVSVIGARWATQSVDDKSSDVMATLQTCFAFWCGAPALGSPPKSDTGDPDTDAAIDGSWVPPVPSHALYVLLEHLPLAAVLSVPAFIASATNGVPDPVLIGFLLTVLQYPLTDRVSQWVLASLDGLIRARKYRVLSHVIHEYSFAVIKQLYQPEYRDGAISVFSKLQLGYQHREDAFHTALGDVIAVTQYLAYELLAAATTAVATTTATTSATPAATATTAATAQPAASSAPVATAPSAPSSATTAPTAATAKPAAAVSGTPSLDRTIDRWSELCYALMYHHNGFPVQYLPLVQVLTNQLGRTAPNEAALRSLLGANAWMSASSGGDAASAAAEYGLLFGGPLSQSSTGKAGLTNLGNTCYMASMLQASFFTDALRQRVLRLAFTARSDSAVAADSKTNTPPVRAAILIQLQRLFAHLSYTARPSVTPNAFLKALPARFQRMAQEDATEFAKFLFDYVASALQQQHQMQQSANAKGTKRKPNEINASTAAAATATAMSDQPSATSSSSAAAPTGNTGSSDGATPAASEFDLFGGILSSTVTCTKCLTPKTKYEPLSDISLAFPEDGSAGGGSGTLQLSDMMSDFFRAESLSGSNAYLCSVCASKQSATKTLSLARSPPHLMVSLKRNRYDWKSGTRTKIMTDVKYPALLKVPVEPTSTPTGSGATAAAATPSHAMYVLYAAVIHSGSSAQFGHYYTIARNSSVAARSIVGALPATATAASSATDDKSASAEPPISIAGFPRAVSGAEWAALDARSQRSAAADDDRTSSAGGWYVLNDSMVSGASFHTLHSITDTFPNDVVYALFYVRVEPNAVLEGTAAALAAAASSVGDEIIDSSVSLAELRRMVQSDNVRFRSEYHDRLQAESDRQHLNWDALKTGKWFNYEHESLKQYADPEADSHVSADEIARHQHNHERQPPPH